MATDVTATEPQTDAPVLPKDGAGDAAAPSWFDRVFRPSILQRTTEQPSRTDEGRQPAPKPSGDQSASRTADAPTGDPDKVVMTRTEYDEKVRREAQAMKDKEIARERAEREREAEREKREQLKKLKDENVYKYVEERDKLDQEQEAAERDREAQEQVNKLLYGVAETFDKEVLGPIIDRLPADVKEKILRDAPGTGIENRKHIAEQALTHLLADAEKRGVEKARESLRKNPAFKKEVLVGEREVEDEPDLLPAAAAGSMSSDEYMTQQLRAMAGVIPRLRS